MCKYTGIITGVNPLVTYFENNNIPIKIYIARIIIYSVIPNTPNIYIYIYVKLFICALCLYASCYLLCALVYNIKYWRHNRHIIIIIIATTLKHHVISPLMCVYIYMYMYIMRVLYIFYKIRGVISSLRRRYGKYRHHRRRRRSLLIICIWLSVTTN